MLDSNHFTVIIVSIIGGLTAVGMTVIILDRESKLNEWMPQVFTSIVQVTGGAIGGAALSQANSRRIQPPEDENDASNP